MPEMVTRLISNVERQELRTVAVRIVAEITMAIGFVGMLVSSR